MNNISQMEWKEQTTSEGRKFYFNMITKDSTWEKPDALKSQEELHCDWTEYFNKEGKPYYYNSKTKKSIWEMPKEYLEMIERKKSHNQTLLLSPNNKNTTTPQPNNNSNALTAAANISNLISINAKIINPNQFSDIDQKLKEIEEKKKLSALEMEKLPKEEIDKLFKDCLRKSGVTSTWKWEDCERVLQKEEIWKSVKTFFEKRSLFNEYIRECKNKEREEFRLKKDKLKVKFRQMLEEDTSLTSESKFGKLIMKFCHDERWRAVDEREREELFQDYMDDLEKRENEEKRIIRENKNKIFRKMIEDRRLPSNTKWKDILLNFKDDPIFASMEKIERLKTFTDYITQLETKEKEDRDNARKFMQYRNRENFRELLIEKVNSCDITNETKWKSFVNTIKDSAEYTNLVGQEGSTPKDLFDDVILKLKDNYKKSKVILKNILKSNNIKFTHDNTFEQFEEKLITYEEYNTMKEEMKITLFKHLIRKLKEKEKHNQKHLKKAITRLELYFLRKVKVTKETKFEDVLKNIRNNSKFNLLSEEKILELFESMKDKLIREGDVSNESNINDTSSESGQIKKTIKKKKRSKKKKNDDEDSFSDSNIINVKNIKKRKLDVNNSEIRIKNNPDKKKNDKKLSMINSPSEKEDGETSD